MVKKLFRRIERERLVWFILLSILIHHALITLLLPVPASEGGDERHWKIFPVAGYWPPKEDPARVEETPEKVLSFRVAEEEKTESRKAEEEKKEEVKKKDKERIEEKTEKIEWVPVQGLHYVDIRTNESKEPPREAKYFAPINSMVPEETRAERTNLDRDDGMSEPSGSDLLEDSRPGDAERSMAAHEIEEEKRVEQEKGNENMEAEETRAPQMVEPASSSKEGKKEDSEDVLEERFIVELVPLTPDNAPELDIEKTEDGEIIDRTTGKPVPSVTRILGAAKKKKVAASGKEGEGAGKEIDLAWVEFEGVFGKKMEEERKSFEEARKSHTKGGFTKNIAKVMSQLENFNPDVKPGNQTALNAAYHPFAEYITAFHRKLHPQWGDGYLYALLSKPPGHPHNDMTLWCKLEFVVISDGTIDKVTVVNSSGDLAFDVAAIDAVYAGQPYPLPPEVIKSYNGKVYFRWRFNRNESQCGVWNAEPYIIPAPSAPRKPPEKPPAEVPP